MRSLFITALASVAALNSGASGGDICEPPIIDTIPDFARDVSLADDLLLVAGNDGLSVYTLCPNALQNPILLVTAAPPDGTTLLRVVAGGDLAIVTDGGGSVGKTWLVDLSNPSSPVFSPPILNGAFDTAAVEGDLAVIDFTALPTRLVDVSDFDNPQFVTLNPNASGVGVYDNRAYVIDLNGLLTAFDVSDPANPVLLDDLQFFPGFGNPRPIVFANDRLYAAQVNEIRVADVSDPSNLDLLGGSTIDSVINLDVAASVVYTQRLLFDDAVLDAFDFSDPQAPVQLATVNAPSLNGLAYRDGLVYGSQQANGLSIIDVKSCPAPPIITEQPQATLAADGGPAAQFGIEGSLIESYQWRFNGEPIADGGPYSGATTDTLTVQPSLTVVGLYDVVVSNAQGDIVSDEAILGVVGGAGACPGDLDGNGVVDVTDLLQLLGNWGACP